MVSTVIYIRFGFCHSLLTKMLVYFHLIHTTFRPFLIAESALHAGGSNKGMGELWLRQACRNATDAASDSIDFMHTMFQSIDASTVRHHVAHYCSPAKYCGSLANIPRFDGTTPSLSKHAAPFSSSTRCGILPSTPTTSSISTRASTACSA